MDTMYDYYSNGDDFQWNVWKLVKRNNKFIFFIFYFLKRVL